MTQGQSKLGLAPALALRVFGCGPRSCCGLIVSEKARRAGCESRPRPVPLFHYAESDVLQIGMTSRLSYLHLRPPHNAHCRLV